MGNERWRKPIRLILAAFVVALTMAASASALGALESHIATVYSGACDGQSNVMADGTTIDSAGRLWHRRSNGHGVEQVDNHVLASAFLPLGTRVRFTRKVFGAKIWTVRDSGGAFDLYRPNCDYSGWPGLTNPTLSYHRIE